MNKSQRESLAKVLYDFSKIIFAALIVGNYAVKDNFNQQIFSVGALATMVAIVSGLILESGKERRKK